MFFHISSFEDFEKDLTYHELIKLFDEKHLRYSQGYIYTDDSTQIECSHNTSNNFNTYVVAVSYYDKKSGSHEDFQKGFQFVFSPHSMLPYFRGMEAFSISLSKSWSELSDQQLLFFFRQVARDLPMNEVLALCVCKWAEIVVLCHAD